MMSVLCVGAGGFVGAVSRYGLGLIPLASGLPLVTLLINLVGSVVIGAVAEAASLAPTALPREAVLFLKVGLCGGFTTFSTFSLETLELIEGGQWALAGTVFSTSEGRKNPKERTKVAGVLAGKLLARALLSAA